MFCDVQLPIRTGEDFDEEKSKEISLQQKISVRHFSEGKHCEKRCF
jgi:hypothetical protein